MLTTHTEPEDSKDSTSSQSNEIARLCLALSKGHNKAPVEKAKIEQDVRAELSSIRDLNAKTESGFTLLYYAVLCNYENLFSYLLANKVDLTIKYPDVMYGGEKISCRDILKQQIIIGKAHKKNVEILEEMDKAFEGIDCDEQKLKLFQELSSLSIEDPQYWILFCVKLAGYQHFSLEGYCQGVALMAAQALVLNERDGQNELEHLKRFENRFDKINEMIYSEHPETYIRIRKERKLLEHEKRKKKNKTKHKEEDDLLAFLDCVQLCQHINKYNLELYKNCDRKTRAKHHEHVISMSFAIQAREFTSSLANDQEGGMIIADHFTGVYDEHELLLLLDSLKQTVKQKSYESTITLQLSANKHAITICYDPIRDEWIFEDANPFVYKNTRVRKIVKRFETTEDLTAKLMTRLLSARSSNKLLIRTDVFTTIKECRHLKNRIIKPWHNSVAWREIHAITRSKLSFKDTVGESWMGIASLAGDNKSLSRKNEYISDRVYFALFPIGLLLIAGSILSGGILPMTLAIIGVVVVIGSVLIPRVVLPFMDRKINGRVKKKVLMETLVEGEKTLRNRPRIETTTQKEIVLAETPITPTMPTTPTMPRSERVHIPIPAGTLAAQSLLAKNDAKPNDSDATLSSTSDFTCRG